MALRKITDTQRNANKYQLPHAAVPTSRVYPNNSHSPFPLQRETGRLSSREISASFSTCHRRGPTPSCTRSLCNAWRTHRGNTVRLEIQYGLAKLYTYIYAGLLRNKRVQGESKKGGKRERDTYNGAAASSVSVLGRFSLSLSLSPCGFATHKGPLRDSRT